MLKNKVVRYLIYLTSILFIISAFIPYKVIDPQLLYYDQQFVTTVQKYCTKGKYLHAFQKAIYFEELPVINIAYCSTNGFTRMRVVVNITDWKFMTEDQRFSTMSHEFMHCYFSIKHNPNPEHFMYAFENYLPRDIVEKQLEALLKETCK